jgi:hypothetical protein
MPHALHDSAVASELVVMRTTAVSFLIDSKKERRKRIASLISLSATSRPPEAVEAWWF